MLKFTPMNKTVRTVVIVVLITLLFGIGFYRLIESGRLDRFLPKTIKERVLETTENKIVVKEESAVIEVVEKTSPSVVAIGVTQRVVNPFDPFSLPRNRQNTIGTGFIVSDKGIVVTNRHVVADPTLKYSVVSKDGKKYEITKIYRDPNLDLAIVQVSNLETKAIKLGDSSKIKSGQTVIAIGNALGRFENTVTTGVVSGLGRAVSAGDPFSGETELLDNLIQTDAAINPGNSGGPLLNLSGEVIGVNVATTEGAQNIGFAIPINSVKALVEEFNRTGTVSKAYLGIRYRLISRDVAILNEVPQGAYVQEIVQNSPAEKSGLQPGDIITKIDNQDINTESRISEIIQGKKIGDKIKIEVWSDGNTKTIEASLEESPQQ